jgi:predicted nuclease of restriction endonuclease-like (RecB) superfamily
MVIIVLIIVLTKDKEKDSTPKEEIKYGLSMEELKRRTNPQYLGTKKLLKKDAKEYLELAEGDKLALKYLVKAGEILENIEYQIDDHYNIPFKKFLEKEVKKNKEQAKLTKILFDAQKGINAIDSF